MNWQGGNRQRGAGGIIITVLPFIVMVIIPLLMNFVTSFGELLLGFFDNKPHQKPNTIAFIEYDDDFDLIIEICFYFFVIVFISILGFILIKNRRIPN